MAIAVRQVAQGVASSTSPIGIAFGVNVLSGSTIVAIFKCSASGATLTMIRDNLDGAVNYTIGVSKTGVLPGNIWITYFANCAAGAMTVTATFVNSGGVGEIDIYEVTGLPTTAVTDGNNTAAGSSATITSGTITTTNANDILFGGGMASGNIAAGGGEAGWTFQQNSSTGDGSEYIIVSSTQTNIAATFTQSPSGTYCGAILALEGGGVVAPTVTAQAATNITTTSATFNGNITATGGANATSEGFNWGLTSGYGNTVSASGSFGTGAFLQILTNLSPGQTYHYQAFATNSGGTGTSSDVVFTDLTTPPLTWDSSSSLWDQNVVAWNAGAPMTWDCPTANWDDSINVWDVGTVTWDSPYSAWDDPLTGWSAGSPITWDSQSSLWDSPTGEWDVGNITWDCLNAKWDDPLVSWDTGGVKVYDSGIDYWDSTTRTWDAGILTASATISSKEGIQSAFPQTLTKGTLQSTEGITVAKPQTLSLDTLTSKAGIAIANTHTWQPGNTLTIKSGVSIAKPQTFSKDTLQATAGITIAKPITLSKDTAQVLAGISIADTRTLVSMLDTVHAGITSATGSGGIGALMKAHAGITQALTHSLVLNFLNVHAGITGAGAVVLGNVIVPSSALLGRRQPWFLPYLHELQYYDVLPVKGNQVSAILPITIPGNYLIARVTWQSATGSVISVSDNINGNYTRVPGFNPLSYNQSTYWYYVPNISTGVTTITAIVNGSQPALTLEVVELSNPTGPKWNDLDIIQDYVANFKRQLIYQLQTNIKFPMPS